MDGQNSNQSATGQTASQAGNLNTNQQGETGNFNPQTTLTSNNVQQQQPATGNQSEKKQVTDTYSVSFAGSDTWEEARLNEFSEIAKSAGISAEQAGKIAEWFDKHAGYSEQDIQTGITGQLDRMQQAWEQEILSRKDYQEELTHAKKVVDYFGTPELVEILNQSRLGSNPVLFDFMVKVGKALAEPSIVGNNFKPQAEKPLYERFWGQNTK